MAEHYETVFRGCSVNFKEEKEDKNGYKQNMANAK